MLGGAAVGIALSVAAGCGISVRYLHELLRETNTPLGQWIRDRRLQAAHEDLSDPANTRSIGEIAYARGFADQAQFSRAFRARFGMTASALRRTTRPVARQ